MVPQIKNSWLGDFTLWIVKWFSGFFFSFLVATFGLSMMSYGLWSFVFVLLVTQAIFWRIFHRASLLTTLLFDAGLVFLILVLRLYIIVGPTL